jgi:hypothetical protein
MESSRIIPRKNNSLEVYVVNIDILEDRINELINSGRDFSVYMNNGQYYIIGKDLLTFHFEIDSDRFDEYDFGDLVDYEDLLLANKYNL